MLRVLPLKGDENGTPAAVRVTGRENSWEGRTRSRKVSDQGSQTHHEQGQYSPATSASPCARSSRRGAGPFSGWVVAVLARVLLDG